MIRLVSHRVRFYYGKNCLRFGCSCAAGTCTLYSLSSSPTLRSRCFFPTSNSSVAISLPVARPKSPKASAQIQGLEFTCICSKGTSYTIFHLLQVVTSINLVDCYCKSFSPATSSNPIVLVLVATPVISSTIVSISPIQ